MLADGWAREEVADLLAVDPTTLSKWKARARRAGLAALAARPHRGAEAKLTRRQARRLAGLLAKDPTWHGFPTSLWTGRRVADLIRRRFAVHYHPCHVWRVLRRLGLSPQKPRTPARERDEAAVRHWRGYRWPQIKKGLAGTGGTSCCWTRAGSCSNRSAGGPGPRGAIRPCSGAGTAATAGA